MKPMLLRLLSIMVVAGAVTACSTVTVTTDRDPGAPFGKYKTYALAPAKQGQTLSPQGEAALRDSLRAELAKRGIVPATAGKPDLAVVRHVFLQDKVSVQQYTDWGYGYRGGWPYGYGYYGVGGGMPRTYVDVTQYTQGTLILDFVDTRTKKLVFRGTGQAVVGGVETNAARIREAVGKIVAEYPGGAAH